jgi:hypothetical protein
MRMRGEVNLLAKQQLAVEVMQGDGGASEGLDQGKLNPRQAVAAIMPVRIALSYAPGQHRLPMCWIRTPWEPSEAAIGQQN